MDIDAKFLHDITNHLSVASGQLLILTRRLEKEGISEDNQQRLEKVNGAMDRALRLIVVKRNEVRERLDEEELATSGS